MKTHYVELVFDHTSTEINDELAQRIKQRFPNAELYIIPDYVLDPKVADPDVVVWEARVFVPTEVPGALIAFLYAEDARFLKGLPIDFTELEIADPSTIRDYRKLYKYWQRL